LSSTTLFWETWLPLFYERPPWSFNKVVYIEKEGWIALAGAAQGAQHSAPGGRDR
jgi:hypothetical protein